MSEDGPENIRRGGDRIVSLQDAQTKLAEFTSELANRFRSAIALYNLDITAIDETDVDLLVGELDLLSRYITSVQREVFRKKSIKESELAKIGQHLNELYAQEQVVRKRLGLPE